MPHTPHKPVEKRIVINFRALVDAKNHRDGYEISYRELAEATGLSLRTIVRLYKGEFGRLELIEKLCNYFDCEPGELLSREKP